MSDESLEPDFNVLPSTNTTLLAEVIPDPSSNEASSGTLPGGIFICAQDREKELISALHNLSLYKSPQEFFEDLVITRAPDDVRSINQPTSSSTREEIAAYRKSVLNHQSTKHRFVFQEWPRDPKGKTITPENSCLGKMAGNAEQLWGSTLFDLYSVRRMPNVPNLITYTSGSKLVNWMKENREMYAQDMIERQEKEDDPQIISPCNIDKLIKESETMVINDKWFLEKSWNKDDPSKRFELPESWPPASPFSPSAYPSPWPIQPFTKQHMTRIPTLQQYIPQSLLPAKLVVHDPFNLLSAETRSGYDERGEYSKKFKAEQNIKWNEKEDITHTYVLKHSELNAIRREHDDRQLNAAEQKRLEIREKFLADPHSRNVLPDGFDMHENISGPGPARPPVYVVLPFIPNVKHIEEAHLYIAPVSRIGEGNHSFVYKAELEVPRNALVEPEICNECVYDDAREILLEQDGENGERRDPKWNEKSGKYVLEKTDIWPEMTEMMDPITGKMTQYILNPGQYKKELVYEGPFRVIESRVKDQDLTQGPYCKHLREKDSAIHPLASKVYVAAKLSKQGDRHLAAEAENYQKFPKHFFEHCSGYNILRPTHDPVPVGAVVPQFYGYYVVELSETLEKTDEDTSDSESDSDSGSQKRASSAPYLSPILLLEDCGKPIDPDTISIDDKTEAGTLIYRFHNEGWLHGSVAKRNILRQPGPINARPSERTKNAAKRGGLGKDWSFRLIDFGRSTLAGPDEILLTMSQIAEASRVTGWIGGWGTHEI